MKVVRAPEQWDELGGPGLFLAGGGSTDWRSEVESSLGEVTISVLNPYREDFPEKRTMEWHKQLNWERRHLDLAAAIMFWFPAGTLAPTTLFELGTWVVTRKKLFVGTDPDYELSADVQAQVKIIRDSVADDTEVVLSLDVLVGQVKMWAENQSRLLG